MTKKNFENGRSMVEMLGVLAVMGVLSVGGVAMYTSAMNKHRANELMNAVSMRLMTLAAQRAQGIQLSLSEFGTGKVGSSTISVDTANTNAIVLSLSDVPAAVCQNMFNTKGANVVKMTSNGTELTSANGCMDGKAVTVTFNNDLSANIVTESGTDTPSCNPACTGGKECVNGACVCNGTMYCPGGDDGCSDETLQCCPYVPVCLDRVENGCISYECCASGLSMEGACFTGCPSNQTMHQIDGYGEVTCCIEGEYYDIDSNQCEPCPNGEIKKQFPDSKYSNSVCACSNGQGTDISHGNICTPCSGGEFSWSSYGPIECICPNGWDDDKKDCLQ